MTQTKEGGRKVRETMYEKYGRDYYTKIGAAGGTKSSNGGFASLLVDENGLTGRARARKYGAVGGRISRRKRAD